MNYDSIKIHTHVSEIKTLFTYKNIVYSYIVVEGEPIPFKVSGHEDDIELDDINIFEEWELEKGMKD